MSLRFRRSLRIAPGVRLNLGPACGVAYGGIISGGPSAKRALLLVIDPQGTAGRVPTRDWGPSTRQIPDSPLEMKTAHAVSIGRRPSCFRRVAFERFTWGARTKPGSLAHRLRCAGEPFARSVPRCACLRRPQLSLMHRAQPDARPIV